MPVSNYGNPEMPRKKQMHQTALLLQLNYVGGYITITIQFVTNGSIIITIER